jgi:sulfur carrier protein ThiS
MQITFKLFASLSDYLPDEARRTNSLSLDVDDDCTVEAVINSWALPPRMVHLVLVNGEFVPPEKRAERRLNPQDALAIWPPIAGG